MAKKSSTKATETKTEKRDVAAEVTARIIEALEAGTAPWVRPWKSGVGPDAEFGGGLMPSNAITGRCYRGINVLILWAAATSKGYSDSRWLTFNQAKAAGGSVRKGERASQIVFWKWLVKDEGKPTEKRIPMARTISLFNVAQCDGLDLAAPAPMPEHEAGAADRLAEQAGAVVRRGGDRAFYAPGADFIQMPVAEAFATRSDYESTLLHELTHWTGAANRLDRTFGKRFGDAAYAAEELVAELGSAFLCARLGIEGKLQHAEYLATWVEVLRSDKHAIFTAAREAEKAAALLCPESEESEVEEAA